MQAPKKTLASFFGPFGRPQLPQAPQAFANQTASTTFTAWSVFFVCIALAAAIWWIYSPVRNFGFFYLDDPLYVANNPHLSQGLTLESLVWAFSNGRVGMYIPLVWTSLLLDVSLWGFNAGVFHLTNVGLHILGAWGLFFFVFASTRAFAPSMAVAFLFAVHPIHVESVAWITERKDVLCFVFWAATALAYLGYSKKTSLARYFLVLVLFACALMSKPSAVTLPVILLLFDLWPLKRISFFAAKNSEPNLPIYGQGRAVTFRSLGLLILEKIPLFLMAVLAGILTILLHQGIDGVNENIPLVARAGNALWAYALYIWKIIWPINLSAFYFHPGHHLALWQMAAGLLVVVCGSITVWEMRKTAPYMLVGWLLFIVAVLPNSGLLQAGAQGMADRFVYTGAIGLYLAACFGIDNVVKRYGKVWLKAACIIIFVGIIGAFFLRAQEQVLYWKDSSTSFTRALEINPHNPRIHAILGFLYLEKGLYEESMEHFRTALRQSPTQIGPETGMGLVFAARGKTARALAWLRAGVEKSPESAFAHHNLGIGLLKAGQLEDAKESFYKALELDPDFGDAYAGLGRYYSETGQAEKAVALHRQALAKTLKQPEKVHNNLGILLSAQGDDVGAIAHYLKAQAIAPEMAAPYANMAGVLARIGHTKKAIALYEKALSLEPENASFHNDLGINLAVAGDCQKALEHLNRALELEPDNPLFIENHSKLIRQLGDEGQTALP